MRLREIPPEHAFLAAQLLSGESKETLDNAFAQIVAWTAIDAEGTPIFQTAEQVKALGRKSLKPMKRCVEVAMRLSALSEEAQALVGKDSERAPSASASSESA